MYNHEGTWTLTIIDFYSDTKAKPSIAMRGANQFSVLNP